jgi:hypothetical protein
MNQLPQVPNRVQLRQFSVNREGWEAVQGSLYDFQAYAAAGQTNLQFFQVPSGQSSKTLSDTNMTLAGQLPRNQEFLVLSVEIPFFPTVPAVTAQNPAAFGAGVAAQIVNDAYIVGRTGNVNMVVGSKPYLQEAPIGRFPAKAYFELDAALSDATTAGTAQQSRIAFGKWCGRPYVLKAPILLPENQNFNLTIAWPEGAQAITNPGRIGVILEGILYRRSQ